jgi:hypothetical protein
MKTIYKYPMNENLRIPRGGVILSVQAQHGKIMVWALVDPKLAPERRRVVIRATGAEIRGPEGRYISTFQMDDGLYVYHAFELSPEAPSLSILQELSPNKLKELAHAA